MQHNNTVSFFYKRFLEMPANRTRRILTRSLIALVLSIGIAIFVFKEHLTNVYDNTIQSTSFQNVVLEKDTDPNSTLPEKNLPIDSSAVGPHETSSSSTLHSSKKKNVAEKLSTSSNQQSIDGDETAQDNEVVETPASLLTAKKGKEIKSRDIPELHVHNTRIRLTTFLTIFKQGDYISGMEFSNLYRRDPSLGKLAKSTICSFIEKNISRLTRIGNSFVIQTIDPKGIHTRLKIPFVEDLQINIDNGAELVLGSSFTSTAPAFSKSILLPLQLKRINIIHNGEQFPTSGYVSGDFYFIDYSKTKMAYKIR